MDNLRHTIEVLFRYQESDNVHQSRNSVNKFLRGLVYDVDRNWFQKIFCHYFNRYSDDEVNGIYDILESKWLYPLGTYSHNDKKRKNIFYVLFHFTSEVLQEQGCIPVCKFDQLLRWQELTAHLGEDLFTTSYFAYQDVNRGIRVRNDFAWPWHIPSNNVQIREIWKKGLVDIHYHLNNSYAIYDLNWLSLMNSVIKREKQFKTIENALLCRMVMDNKANSFESLHTLCIRAAAIRLYLFLHLFASKEWNFSDAECKIWLDSDAATISLFQNELQNRIDTIRCGFGLKYGDFVADYAIPQNAVVQNLISDSNVTTSFFVGERRLLYYALKKVYADYEESVGKFASYLYEYLLIKARFREEIIQINQHIGLKNFKQYQDRKDVFLRGTKYHKFIAFLSVNSSIASGFVNYIEAKTGLGTTAYNFEENIKKLDLAISKKYFIDKTSIYDCIFNNRKREPDYSHYFIVQLHKKNQYEEDWSGDSYEDRKVEDGKVRNSSLRKEVKQIVLAYNNLRKSTSQNKYRVCGIDAVASETGCRPEFFGQAYRYLRRYSHPERSVLINNDCFPKIGFTYHVGEDFLDITDGLRAIDEAILFLELQQGDRIGHALALGVDARKYYEVRNNVIVLPQQDMLDNVVWLYVKCQEYGITMPPDLELHLKNLYFELVFNIYPESFGKIENPFVYYQSMLLRSDAPSLYKMKDKGVSVSSSFLHFWDKCGLLQDKGAERARKNSVACTLYYYYQFNKEVKEKGCQSTEVQFPVEYISVVETLQRQMMRDIAAKGIGIETNPSSNFNIAQLKRYDNHPITKFFNLGLTYDNKVISECPQISVSINTDDQGLFSTSLENEYAIMAAALVKQKNPDGTLKYSERMVYDWLERIRQLGWEQIIKKSIV